MNRMTALVAGLVAVNLFSACGGEATIDTSTAPKLIRFETNRPVTRVTLPERVTMYFEGFTPGGQVTVRTAMADGSKSVATFLADENGRFDTASAAPVGGSYQGADADGLFWSMRADEPSLLTAGPLHVDVTVEVDGVVVTGARLERFSELLPKPPSNDEGPVDPCGSSPRPLPETL